MDKTPLPKLAIVIGSGRCVWDDLRRIPKAEQKEATWFAINDMIVFSPTVHHGVSHHSTKLEHWFALRTRDGYRNAREKNLMIHSSQDGAGVHRVWPGFRYGGSSALLAVRIAMHLGFERVVIVGVPLDYSGYVWSDPENVKHNYDHFRKAWTDIAANLTGVKAVSGWLVKVLGEYKPS